MRMGACSRAWQTTAIGLRGTSDVSSNIYAARTTWRRRRSVANAILHPPHLKGWPQKDPLRGRAANSLRARSSVVVYGKAHLLVAR